ncbi:SGNH/GDSL hydrolase family protein [uncultured Gimesia sp.]|uniref:SGNH/GDSL hydrolase family protein n=1 Tax=uncultured Gimesia sp. TaxID=1678688 RepID=UPI0030DD7A2D|tara:strand:+ start:30723 stop:31925 length:1203 start_codon:yes stop_codon:yes gene_type:complete
MKPRPYLILFFMLSLFAFSHVSSADDNTKPAAKTESESGLKNPLRLVLPPIIYAVPGLETNVYFDNVVLAINPANYVFDVHCNRGFLQNDRWTYTPEEKEIGDYAFELKILDQNNQVVSSQKSRLRVVPAATGKDKTLSLLMIGDSLTHGSIYARHVLELSKKFEGPQLKFVGSHNPNNDPEVRHEGYSGWTALRFATLFKETARTGDHKERGSPFLYADEQGKPKFDFPRYCKEFNDGKAPDVVTIFLGPNDVYSASDETIETIAGTMLKNVGALVDMIQAYSKETKIGLMLPVPPAATQNAFGNPYDGSLTRWQYKRNQQYVVELMSKIYKDKADQNIFLVPTNLNLNCVHNYPTRKGPLNSRNPQEVVRQNNAVHPDLNGYQQIGDSVFFWLKEMSK